MKCLQNVRCFFIWWAAGMLHIVCIIEPYQTCGTWHDWVTQNCTQGFVGPCIVIAVNVIKALVENEIYRLPLLFPHFLRSPLRYVAYNSVRVHYL